MADRVYLVLKYVGEERDRDADWEVQGIFSKREKAIIACRDENHCFADYEIDEELPQEPCKEDGWTFPVTECKKNFNPGLGERFFNVDGNEIPKPEPKED